MKTQIQLAIRRRTGGTGVRHHLLAALTVAVGLAVPLSAELIDDFSGGQQRAFNAYRGVPEFKIVDGQGQLTLPSPEAYVGCFHRTGTYDVLEGQPVEVRKDVVSLNGDDVYTSISVVFIGAPGVAVRAWNPDYNFYWLRSRVGLYRTVGVGVEVQTFFDTTIPRTVDPVTLSLTLTRQGTRMLLRAKAVQRDNPAQVVFEREVIDVAPPGGPVYAVGFKFGTVGPSTARPRLVCDNLAISAEPMPRVLEMAPAADGQVKLRWRNQSVLLESETLDGPWMPRTRIVAWDGTALGVSLPANEPARFFRLGRGSETVEAFDTPGEGIAGWKTASPVVGQVRRPVFVVSMRRGRVYGVGGNNNDFVLFRALSSVPSGDALASVDIVDWNESNIEDAEFGLLLRVRSTQLTWMCETEGLPHDRYAGLLTFQKGGSSGESVLSITGPGGEVLERRRFAAVDPARQYRLQFSAVSDRLRLDLFDREDLATPMVTCTARDGRVTEGNDALYGTKSAGATYDVTIDDYCISQVWR